MYKYESGKSIDLSKAKEIAAGGEGRILEHPTSAVRVIKLYFQPRPKKFADHLKKLGSLPADVFIVPLDVIYTTKDEVAGFEMLYVNFNEYWLFNNLFNKGFCNSNNVDDKFKIGVIEQMKAAVEGLHKSEILIGDLNQYNLFVSKQGKILFVDTDSYGTKTNPHSGIVIDEIRDWTNPFTINEQSDAWAYDILAFWSMTYVHPFKWVVPGNTDSLEQRIKSHKSILNSIPNIKIPPIYKPISGEPLKQFQEIFSGRRYMVSFTNAVVQTGVVIKQVLSSGSLNIRELDTNIKRVNVSDNFIAIFNGVNWKLIETKIPSITRTVDVFDAIALKIENVFPSDNKPVFQKSNKLVQTNALENSFRNPEFYYNNGFLAVFDYGADVQSNFNLNNQLAGIDHKQNSIFAKSLLLRDAPIQNFGAKKFLNIPVRNSYTLIEIPFGTKNAWYCNGFVGVETREKNKTKFLLFEAGNSKKNAELHQFSYFAVSGTGNKATIFVPEDGRIDVYKDLSIVGSFDIPLCSSSSKLYKCNSGILMLENNILYLLNTK